MSTDIQHAAYAYLNAFIDELARCGVQHAVVCPGSRSTPLAMILTEHPEIKLWMHLDERSAAFFALGLAKAQRKPVILLCTSGTAAANFMPAVVEAHYGRVPLIVLTADRPPELRDVGAPQTIDQLRLYGTHAKWFIEMALPEETASALRYARTVAARAVSESFDAPAGPVHLNFPLREPLVPLPSKSPIADIARSGHQPYTRVERGKRTLDSSSMQALASELVQIERGLIVCGSQDDPDFPEAVTRLAAVLGYPILADPLSQVKCGPHLRDHVVDAYDAFLRDSDFVGQTAPEVVIRFGAVPTSKPLTQYLQKYPECRQFVVDGGGGWNDPALLVTDMIHADATLWCDEMSKKGKRQTISQWLEHWLQTDRQTRVAINTQIMSYDEWFEGSIFAELGTLLPDGATLYTSSSMPVRDMDTFLAASDRRIRFMANRGANGIDGVVSSALGASAGSEGSLVLVIGDIAFYHDMNGLLAAKLHQLNATIILINNDGGGIFSFLPQADYPDHFEQLYGTPHGLDFRHAAEMYGAKYVVAENWNSFHETVTAGIQQGGLNIVEVQTDRQRNVVLHRAIWQVVSAALSPAGAD